MRAVRSLVEQCYGEGVRYFFGMQGGSIAPLFNELYDYPGIRTILARHEQGAAFEATGYAWITGKAQMCGGTVGPGALNLISGLLPAYVNAKPVLAIACNVTNAQIGKAAIQESTNWGPRTLSQVEMAKPITKWAVSVFRAELLPEAVRRAFRVMYSGRQGPVLLDILYDTLRAEIDVETLPAERYRPVCKVGGDPEKITEAAELLVNAQSPAILAGGGVVSSEAFAELLELSELLAIPVATTLMGKSSFPEDHALALGCAGFYGHEPAKRTLKKENTDVLLAAGCTFAQNQTLNWSKDFGGDKIVYVDIDPAEIGKNYPVEVGIVGDAKLVLRDLIRHIKKTMSKWKPDRLKELHDLKERRMRQVQRLKDETMYYAEAEICSHAIPMKPQRALKELRDFLNRDAIILTDSGNNLGWSETYFQTYLPKTFIVDGYTHMGNSVATAIGVKLGAPNRQVVDIVGNAGFHMLCHEVVTATSYSIPVVWFVLDDGILGMIAHAPCKFGFGLWEPERYASIDLYDMDFVKFAEACHAYGQRVERPGEIKDALKNASDSGKPSIIDVVIDRDEIHKGTVGRFKEVIEKYPGLTERKIPKLKWPTKII
jgi:acetolactate synthase-1/2/3 large subunit